MRSLAFCFLALTFALYVHSRAEKLQRAVVAEPLAVQLAQ